MEKLLQIDFKKEVSTTSDLNYRDYNRPSYDHHDGKEVTADRSCVKACLSGYQQVSSFCLKMGIDKDIDVMSRELTKVAVDMKLSWHLIVATFFIAIVFAYVLLVLLRHATKFCVWFVYFVMIIGLIALTVVLWIAVATTKEQVDGSNGFLGAAIVVTIITIIVCIVIICMRNKIAYVIKIFKEAAKALIDIPLIIFEPLLVSLACSSSS